MAAQARCYLTGSASTGATVSPALTGWTNAGGDLSGTAPHTGDVVLLISSVSNSGQTVSQTGGSGTWTIHGADSNLSSSTALMSFAAVRVWTGTETAPTFTWSNGGRNSWTVVAIGSDSGETLSVDAWATTELAATTGTSHTPNAATASSTDFSVVLTAARATANGSTSIGVTPPGGGLAPMGSSVNLNSSVPGYSGSGTVNVANAGTFDGFVFGSGSSTEMARQIQKIYLAPGQLPSTPFISSGPAWGNLSSFMAQGGQVLISIRAPGPTVALWASTAAKSGQGPYQDSEFASFCEGCMSKLGTNWKGILWQECNSQGFFNTAGDYHTYFAHYAPLFRKYAPGINLVYDPTVANGSGNQTSAVSYFPTGGTDVDEVYCDFYQTSFRGSNGQRLGNLEAVADAHSIPFGLGEWGAAASGWTWSQSEWDDYISYLTTGTASPSGAYPSDSFEGFEGRASAGKPNGWLIYFASDGNGGLGGAGTTDSDSSGNGLGSSSDKKIPGIVSFHSAVSAGYSDIATGQELGGGSSASNIADVSFKDGISGSSAPSAVVTSVATVANLYHVLITESTLPSVTGEVPLSADTSLTVEGDVKSTGQVALASTTTLTVGVAGQVFLPLAAKAMLFVSGFVPGEGVTSVFDAILVLDPTSQNVIATLQRGSLPLEAMFLSPVGGSEVTTPGWVQCDLSSGLGVSASTGKPYFDTQQPSPGEAATLWLQSSTGAMMLDSGD